MRYRFLYLLTCVVLISSCSDGYRPKQPYQLTITDFTRFDSIPSASGIAIFQDQMYIVGDDAAYIYKLHNMASDKRDYMMIYIPGADTNVYRIPKSVKNDFEAATLGTINEDIYLLAFGSGTLDPYRDSLLLLNVQNDSVIKKLSLAVFYDSLMARNKMDKKDFNIEGATIAGNFLYLFNRANGLIFQVDWPEFFQYINDPSGTVPVSSTHKIDLPKDGEIQAGFSGACTLDKKTIVFTASMEDTKDWVQDGEVKGSYIGILDIVNPQVINLYAGMAVQHDSTNSPLRLDASKIKLESVDVLNNSRDKISLIAVADNDDGTSSIYHIRLDKK